jgi:hypothetical protein
MFSVKIDNARLDAEGEHSGRWLVVGMPLEIRVAARARDAAEESNVRRRHAPDQYHE